MPTVLLVDDEPELLRAVRIRLTASGFACQVARNGREALESVERARPDLIVADLLMPEMDGYELVRRLRADPRTAGISVLVLSAVPQYAIDRRKEPLEADRVLHKPFDSQELVKAARELAGTTASGGRHG
jgi:CheY-like chemotaxis protein